MKKKYIVITIICALISLISGIISKDILIGGTALFTALTCSYFASEGKKINYILGLINSLLIGYVSLRNNLYGMFFFYIFIFSPLQIQGLLAWNKNLNEEKNVKVREFTLKKAILIVLFCLIGSILIGYLLTLIPGQQLAFMDSTSNCINLCGVILMILRFKESWWLWLINNTVDMIIWTILFINKGVGSFMMFLVALGYLIINIYGIIKWTIEAKKNNSKSS